MHTFIVYKAGWYLANTVPHHDEYRSLFGFGVTNSSVTAKAVGRGHILHHLVTLCSSKDKNKCMYDDEKFIVLIMNYQDVRNNTMQGIMGI
jgi:hypothetical protein